MQKVSYKVPAKLLSKNNFKTIKGEKYGYTTYILYMSPYKANSKGKNLCPYASKGCAASCLVGSGFGGMYESVMAGRVNKSEYFLADRAGFMAQIEKEIASKVRNNKKKNNILTFRLNGTSDIPFENIIVRDGKNIFELFPDIQFYDYTKNWKRFYSELPANYHLTFSRSENNETRALEILAMGYNVAMVFDKIPSEYKGYKVVNGDESDLRFKDGNNVIVGLKYKMLTGKNADNTLGLASGFVIRTESSNKKLETLAERLERKLKTKKAALQAA